MKITKYLTALAAACSLLCLATPASAAVTVFTVNGNDNPWNIGGGTGDGNQPQAIFLQAGESVSWVATGTVNIGGGNVNAGPDGANPNVTHDAENGVSGLTALQGSLIGVFQGLSFVMGSSGGGVAGAAGWLYLGIMDGSSPSWDNNSGSFEVTITTSGGASQVPDFGSTLALMLVGLGLVFVYRKHVLA